MTAATINMQAALDSLGGTTTVGVVWSAVVMRGGQQAVRVNGQTVTFPAVLTCTWNGTSWDSQPTLTDVDIDCYWLITLAREDFSTRRSYTVQLPAGHGAAVDFGSLAQVDPATLTPTPAVLQTWLDEIAATYLPLFGPRAALDSDGIPYFEQDVGWFFDTDGVPYWSTSPTSDTRAVLHVDTDGVPYFATT